MQKTSQNSGNSKPSILETGINTTQTQTTPIFKQAIVFEIELLNGKKSSVTTICNNSEIDFEEMVAYMSDGLRKSERVKAITPTVGSISSGEYKPIFFYDRTEFDRSEVLNNPNLRRAYGL